MQRPYMGEIHATESEDEQVHVDVNANANVDVEMGVNVHEEEEEEEDTDEEEDALEELVVPPEYRGNMNIFSKKLFEMVEFCNFLVYLLCSIILQINAVRIFCFYC